MHKALVIGIDHYADAGCLYGCVNDAHSMRAALERHGDGSVNFDVRLETATGEPTAISRGELKDAVEELFRDPAEVALFFFAGDGHIESSGGYLCASDCSRGDDGLSLTDVLAYANGSPARNKVVVLDCCHAGFAGTTTPGSDRADLTEGLTILTASSAEQYAAEEQGEGVFTKLFVDALNGGAANLVGDITPGSIYAHIDQSLGPWQQRPLFKTNVRSFVSLRRVQAPIPLRDLQRLTELFPEPGYMLLADADHRQAA